METYFGVEHDYFSLRGQDNRIRFLPVDNCIIRLHEADNCFETLARIIAATMAGCHAVLSIPLELAPPLVQFLKGHRGQQLLGDIALVDEDEQTLADRLTFSGRIRYAGEDRVSTTILQAAAQKGVTILRSPVYMEGRIELLHYLRQQTVCHNYHRYGNLGKRALNIP